MSSAPSPRPEPKPPLPATAYPGAATARTGNGSGWILALAILQVIGGAFMYTIASVRRSPGDPSAIGVLIVTMLLGTLFFGLWIWGRRSPFPALLTALIVFVSFHLLDAVINPMSLLQGILVKIILLVGLCAALKKAYVTKREQELEAAESEPAVIAE